jgi:hypothetical protein
MTRRTFLVLSGLMASAFGLVMLIAPAQMLGNMTTSHDANAAHVLQWMGCTLLAVGVINILARSDAGSPALRAILIGNILLHVLGFAIDLQQHLAGFILASGLTSGTIVHGALTIGFGYYLATFGRSR